MSPDESLFQLTQQELELLARLDEIEQEIAENGGVLSLELEEVWDRTVARLAEAEDAIEEKYKRYGYVILEQRANAETLRSRAEILRDRAQKIEDRADRKDRTAERLHRYLQRDMKARGIKEMEFEDFAFVFGKPRGRRPYEITADPEYLPPRFRRHKFRFNVNGDVSQQTLEELRAMAKQVGAKVSVEPRKNEIYAALTSGDPEIENYAVIGEKDDVLKMK